MKLIIYLWINIISGEILTCVLPSANGTGDWIQDTESYCFGGGITDMMILENSGHQLKEQIEEMLGLKHSYLNFATVTQR